MQCPDFAGEAAVLEFEVPRRCSPPSNASAPASDQQTRHFFTGACDLDGLLHQAFDAARVHRVGGAGPLAGNVLRGQSSRREDEEIERDGCDFDPSIPSDS